MKGLSIGAAFNEVMSFLPSVAHAADGLFAIQCDEDAGQGNAAYAD